MSKKVHKMLSTDIPDHLLEPEFDRPRLEENWSKVEVKKDQNININASEMEHENSAVRQEKKRVIIREIDSKRHREKDQKYNNADMKFAITENNPDMVREIVESNEVNLNENKGALISLAIREGDQKVIDELIRDKDIDITQEHMQLAMHSEHNVFEKLNKTQHADPRNYIKDKEVEIQRVNRYRHDGLDY